MRKNSNTVKPLLGKIILIGCFLLFTACRNSYECMKLDQSCVEFSDHGYVALFFANGNCAFFDEYHQININTFDSTQSEAAKRHKALQFRQSAQIVNPGYYKSVKRFAKKYMAGNQYENCAISLQFLDTNGNIISEGSISKTDYFTFKSEIEKLDAKYGIPKEQQNKSGVYFWIIETGCSLVRPSGLLNSRS